MARSCFWCEVLGLAAFMVALAFFTGSAHCSSLSTAAVGTRAGSSLLFQADEDPMGDKDSFAQLSPDQQRTWAHREHRGLKSKSEFLRNLKVRVPVSVRLVGFDGHGAGEVDIKPEDLSKMLEHLKLGTRVPVMHSPRGSGRHLGLEHLVVFSVQRTPQRLQQEIFSALHSFFTSRSGDTVGRNASVVPHSVVDKIIDESARAQEEEEGGTEGYSIYLLNLKPMPAPYAYSYAGGASAFAAQQGHDFWCPGTSFQNKRYLWVDLNAGPVPYGPQEGEGDGQGVHYSPGQSARATGHSFLKFNPNERPKPLMAHLASLVSSAVQHLISPPLLHHPLPLSRLTRVLLLHLVGPTRHGDKSAKESGVSLSLIKQELVSSSGPSVVLKGQTLEFSEEKLPLAQCDLCTLALHSSIRTSTRIVEGEGVVHSRYLDALELHHLLHQYWDSLPLSGRGVRKGGEESLSSETQAQGQHTGNASLGEPMAERLVPVFLFDLPGGEPLLLDGKHQALAFEDMVIAVRSHSAPLPSLYSCNGAPVMINPSAVHRPVFGALLQTLWGITPTQTSWSEARNSPIPFPSWRWTFGHSPFGPFSSSSSLSLLLRDTALRNSVLSLFNQSLGPASLLIHQLLREFPSEDAVFGLKDGVGSRGSMELRERWDQRWGVLHFKLDKAAHALSTLDFNTAQYLLLSARHDLSSLFRIATLSASHMHTSLICFQEVPLSASTIMLTVASPVACLIILLSMKRIFQRKEKMF